MGVASLDPLISQIDPKPSSLAGAWNRQEQDWTVTITKAFDALKRDPNIGRAGALRQAMLSLIAEGENTWHPSKWAPFVVVGEGGS